MDDVNPEVVVGGEEEVMETPVAPSHVEGSADEADVAIPTEAAPEEEAAA